VFSLAPSHPKWASLSKFLITRMRRFTLSIQSQNWAKKIYDTIKDMSCPYAWLHTWWLVTSMSIIPLGLMYVFKVNVCFHVTVRY
jgi:hypothetical protein